MNMRRTGPYSAQGHGASRGQHEPFTQNRLNMLLDGRRLRKPVLRKSIDFNSTILRHLQTRIYQRNYKDLHDTIPTMDSYKELEPVFSYSNPAQAFCTKYVHTSMNKFRCPIHVCVWTPDGRRLITGSHTGELTLWNGKEFNFEHLEEAHDNPIRSMVWSWDDTWMVTADDAGKIKYWQSSMTNVKVFQGHQESIRDISFAPTSKKFATCSDDRTISVWDFETYTREQSLTGHGWDVKTVQWHPTKGLISSGSKDNMVKLWDPRSGKNLCSLHGHNNTVTKVRWNKNGMWFVTASRDQVLKMWDIRTLKWFKSYKGHKREVTCVEWHPSEEQVFCSGSFDGSILYWMVESPDPQAEICGAHDHSVWSLAWHPLGHLLASCSNDKTTRFWARNRPGDEMKDKYNANQLPDEEKGDAMQALAQAARNNPKNYGKLPKVLQELSELPSEDEEGEELVIPGMGSAENISIDVKEAASLYDKVGTKVRGTTSSTKNANGSASGRVAQPINPAQSTNWNASQGQFVGQGQMQFTGQGQMQFAGQGQGQFAGQSQGQFAGVRQRNVPQIGRMDRGVDNHMTNQRGNYNHGAMQIRRNLGQMDGQMGGQMRGGHMVGQMGRQLGGQMMGGQVMGGQMMGGQMGGGQMGGRNQIGSRNQTGSRNQMGGRNQRQNFVQGGGNNQRAWINKRRRT